MKATAALRYRTQVESESKHLVLGHSGSHPLIPVVGLGAEDLAPTPVDVRHDRAEILLRHADISLDYWFEQDGTRVKSALSNRHRAGDLKRHVVRVDLVELAVDKRHPDVDHRISGDDSLGHVVDDALLNRHSEVLRDGAAEDLVLPNEALAALGGGHLDDADPVLPVASRLLDVPALGPAVA